MAMSEQQATVWAGHPSYPDHCRWCRRTAGITWASREWIHYPATVVPAESGTVVAYYRCRRCDTQWTCGWADGGIDRSPSGKTPPVLGTALRREPTETGRRARSRPSTPTNRRE
jgi:hypothetical protein